MSELGDEIRLIRTASKIKAVKLARSLGVARSTLYAYETGARVPSIDQAREIERICSESTGNKLVFFGRLSKLYSKTVKYTYEG